jgi:hypothetical protein
VRIQVKLEKHNAFADENDMYSYFVSAKTGDNVNSAFHRVAADWAGVVLTKAEQEVTAVAGALARSLAQMFRTACLCTGLAGKYSTGCLHT